MELNPDTSHPKSKPLRCVISQDHWFDVIFTSRFSTEQSVIELLKTPKECLFVFDEGFIAHWPQLASELEEVRSAPINAFTMPGGEASKDGLTQVLNLIAAMNELRLSRSAVVFVFGGGAVLDAVGLAASLYHRGVKIVRFPTTVLAQNDAGIGVKNGVNLLGQKNCVGVFQPPELVVNDFRFLTSLESRDKRAGMAEAVKVALLKDPKLFSWIESNVSALANFESWALEELIVNCARLHLDHIANAGDPFEKQGSRPLDFGHWLAHRLESLNSDVRHGEAVANGIWIDSLYSASFHGLSEIELNRIKAVLLGLGFSLELHLAYTPEQLIVGLDDFRVHLGGEFEISLLRSIGNSFSSRSLERSRIIEVLIRELP